MPTLDLSVDWPSGKSITVAVAVHERPGPSDAEERDVRYAEKPMPRSEPRGRIASSALRSLPKLKEELKRLTRAAQPGTTVYAWVYEPDDSLLLQVLCAVPPVEYPIHVDVGRG